MSSRKIIVAIAVAVVFSVASFETAYAHGPAASSGNQSQMPMMGGYGMMGQMPMMGGPGMIGGQMPMMGGPGMMGGQMPMMGGYGMMGQMPMMSGCGMMGQMPMMGSGMMGGQMPMMGGWGRMQILRRDLKADEVKHMMEHRLVWTGNQDIKLGKVTEKDGDSIEVEIVNKDDKVVQKFEVDRHTGWMQPAQ